MLDKKQKLMARAKHSEQPQAGLCERVVKSSKKWIFYIRNK